MVSSWKASTNSLTKFFDYAMSRRGHFKTDCRLRRPQSLLRAKNEFMNFLSECRLSWTRSELLLRAPLANSDGAKEVCNFYLLQRPLPASRNLPSSIAINLNQPNN